MQKVTGIGGVFFKAKDPEATSRWYADNLGIPVQAWGDCRGATFEWRHKEAPDRPGVTVWSIFPESTDYFGQDGPHLMINYRVEDLDAMLAQLREAGAEPVGEIVEEFNGRFGWVRDPDGRRIELWEPAAGY